LVLLIVKDEVSRMRRSVLILLLIATPVLAQTRPSEIRRGMEIPTTNRADRQEIIAQAIARKIEPSLKGDVSRLDAYVEFWRRESIHDPRVFASDVRAEPQADGGIVLSGWVEYPQHQLSLRLLLTTLGFNAIKDRMEVAPTAAVRETKFGVVSSPTAGLYSRIDEPREHLTEALYGEPVFIVAADRDYFCVHASDGYVGYVRSSDITLMKENEFTSWIQNAGVRLTGEFKTTHGILPVGARLRLIRAGNDWLECKAPRDKDLKVPVGIARVSNSLETMQKIEGAILAASKLTGTKYVWGGRTADGIDCSGLTQMAYASHGINLPRDADQQALVGRLVGTHWYRDAMARGDLLFFIGRRGTISHVALYLGEGKFIEAADGGVKISTLSLNEQNAESRRDRSFAFARRVIE
jgi:hypothetical protein